MGGMKRKKHQIGAAIMAVIILAGCATAEQRARTFKVAGVATDIIGRAGALAVKLVIAKAQGPDDLYNKGNFLDSAALAVRSAEKFGVTGDDISSLILQATDASKQHWRDLAEQAGQEVAKAAADKKAGAVESIAIAFNQEAEKARQTAMVDSVQAAIDDSAKSKHNEEVP